MRKLFRITPLIVAVLSLFTISCSEDDGLIVDWSPVSFNIYVTDSQGNNLVTSDYKGVTATYLGTTYDIKDLTESRACMPIFHGLCFIDVSQDYYYDKSHGNYLQFGEIDGAADMDEDIVLNWSDGTHNTIHYHCAKHNEKKLSCDRVWKVDGKKLDDNSYTFVK